MYESLACLTCARRTMPDHAPFTFCNLSSPQAPNVVTPIFVLPDAIVYAAYYSTDSPPLVEMSTAKAEYVGCLCAVPAQARI